MAGPECRSWISQNSLNDLREIEICQGFCVCVFCNLKKCISVLWKEKKNSDNSFSRPFKVTPPNVWPHDGDIVVPVQARLLVHKAQSVHELVGNHSNLQAVRALEGNSLSPTTWTKVRPTPGETRWRLNNWLWEIFTKVELSKSKLNMFPVSYPDFCWMSM